jgi:hypothetical protein
MIVCSAHSRYQAPFTSGGCSRLELHGTQYQEDIVRGSFWVWVVLQLTDGCFIPEHYRFACCVIGVAPSPSTRLADCSSIGFYDGQFCCSSIRGYGLARGRDHRAFARTCGMDHGAVDVKGWFW